jgi:hypothetical protein
MKIFKAVLVGSLIAFSGLAAAQNCQNPYGRYGNPYSPDSLNNPYGAGNPYNPGLIYVVPVK